MIRLKALFILLLLVSYSQTSIAADISLYRGGLERRGGEGDVPGEVGIAWQFRTAGPVNNSPVLKHGKVYIADAEGVLYCLNADDGKEIWRFEARHKRLTTPAVAAGNIILPSSKLEMWEGEDGIQAEEKAVLYCMDAESGGERWKKRFTERFLAPPAVVGGRIYFGRMDRKFCCLELETGKQLWDFRTRGCILSSAAFSDERVIFGSEDRCLYCLAAESGRKLWKTDLKSPIRAAPAVANGMVYLACQDGKVYCLKLGTGEKIWASRAGGAVEGAVVTDGERVFACSSNGSIYCFSAGDGKRLWRYGVGSPIVAPPAVSNGRLVVGSTNRLLYCVDAIKGRLVWKFSVRGKIVASPTLYNKNIYFGSTGNRFYCLKAKRTVEKGESRQASMTDTQFEKSLSYAKELIEAGRYRDAVVVCKGIVEAREDSAVTRLCFARACEGTGELGLAGKQYGLAVQLEPRNHGYRNALGRYLSRLGRLKEAMEQFRYAKSVAPAAPEAYVNIAGVYLVQGKPDEAEKELNLAMERRKDNPEAILLQAKICIAKLEFNRARSILQRCLKMEPVSVRAEEMLKKINKGG